MKRAPITLSVTFLPGKRAIAIKGESSILELALSNKIDLGHSCGGMGSCTTCRVIIESDLTKLPERNELESEIAESRNFAEHERLGCQLEPTDGMIIRIPPLKHE